MRYISQYLLRATEVNNLVNEFDQALSNAVESAVAFKNRTKGELGYTDTVKARLERLNKLIDQLARFEDRKPPAWNAAVKQLRRAESRLYLALADVQAVLPAWVLEPTEVRRRVSKFKRVADDFRDKYLTEISD